MAIYGRKISSFNQLNSLTGDEFLMVAYNGKTYKIPVSLLLGNKIESIVQQLNDADGADNPIRVTLSDGSTQTFHVYNGKTGKQGLPGEQGAQGVDGNSGIILYNNTIDDVRSRIVNSVNGENYSDEELAQRMLSAAMGKYLNDQIKELKEVYFNSQEEYDEAEYYGLIREDTKYYIFEEE